MVKPVTRVMATLATAGVCTLACGSAGAATPACSALSNTAYVHAGNAVYGSNAATIRIDELLDLQLSAATASVALPREGQGAAAFQLTNGGNGDETFLLSASIDGLDATIQGFAIDRDGNGVFDAATDLAIAPGAATPKVAPGQSVKLLVLLGLNPNTALPPATGTLHIHARAVTGTGQPGTDLAGLGDGGCDAVVGGTTASGDLGLSLTVAAGTDTSQIQVIKSQAVMAPNGLSTPVTGATVTYSIESRFGGSGVVRSARLADPIPPGTAYIPGSLELDGVTLSDAADGDAGSFDGGAIRVALGDVPAPATRRIQFKVKIQ